MFDLIKYAMENSPSPHGEGGLKLFYVFAPVSGTGPSPHGEGG